ncbi:MAG: NAD(P)-dependent oxidoreductase [Gemmataceae bacterium]
MRSCRLAVFFLFLVPLAAAAQDFSKMKFNDVREVAPGVFFRYSAISATDKSVVFGGTNNIWIVFDEYVLVFDANFPKEAGDVIAAIKKTTDKPIRYVVDSHHHGDHAYGNAVFSKQGASVVAQFNCARLLRIDGPDEFAKAGKGKGGREDIAKSFLRVPDLVFDDKLVLDDGKQRVELLFLGHAHTAGDCFAYLPKHKVLCTGDACTNGPFNYMGHSDSASWIRVLDKAQQLDVKIVCPGHGPLGGPDVLKKQQRFFVELRDQVKKGVDAGKGWKDIAKTIDMPWHKEWTGIEASERLDAIEYVFDEMVGKAKPWDLFEDWAIYEGPSPVKGEGWTPPKKIVVPSLMPARLWELKQIAPDVLFVPVRSLEEAATEVAEADAVLGFCSSDIVKSGKRLRWIQVGHAGVEKDLVPELKKSEVTLTNLQRLHGPNVSEQAFALLLGLSRGVAPPHPIKADGDVWTFHKTKVKPTELHGKTMLVVGMGGIGTQIAKRAHAFGMKVMALDLNDKLPRPDTVFSLETPDKFMERLPQADVVVLSCPLTEKSRGMMGAEQFAAMKKTAYFINVARGGLVKTDDLVAALKKRTIAGAGLDVADPEPLPDSHPLWTASHILITPHIGGSSPDLLERQWRLYRENVRRFVAGERLLCVVDKAKGF